MKALPFLLTTLSIGMYLSFSGAPEAHAGVIYRGSNNLDLVGYWSFNEGTSTVVGDFSTYKNNGTLTNMGDGTGKWVNGRVGKALSFDGSDDYVLASTQPTLNSQASFTYTLWLLVRTYTNGCGGSGTYFLDRGPPNNPLVSLCANSDQFNFERRFDDGSGYGVITAGTIQKHTWTHIAMVRDYSAALFRFYVNGVQVGTAADGASALTPDPPKLGGHSTGCPGALCFNGLVDDFRIYKRALGADEVKKLYEMGATSVKSPNKLGLVGHWSFDEGTSTQAGDFSGNRNNGTLTNMGDGSGKWVPGRVGKALSFDGSDDKVTSPMQGPTGNLTICAWFKPNLVDSTQNILLQGGDESSEDQYFRLEIHTSNKLQTLFGDGAGWPVSITGTTILKKGTWYHGCGVRDSSAATTELYLNATREANGGGVFTAASAPGITVGAYVSPNFNFPGLIDDVRIYNRALNADEVRNLYQSSKYVALNSSQDNQITNGLVGMWDFNGNHMGSTSARDSSGNGNTGWLINGPTKVAGKVGQGLSFDGVGSYVKATTTNLIDGQGSMSAFVWAKPNSLVNFRRFLQQPVGNNHDNGNFSITLNNGANSFRVQLKTSGGGIDVASSGGAINIGQWYLIGFTYDGSIVRLYSNGTGVGSTALTGTINTVSDDLFIGAGGTIGQFFNGLLDEPRIYNRALKADEVKRLYLMGR